MKLKRFSKAKEIFDFISLNSVFFVMICFRLESNMNDYQNQLDTIADNYGDIDKLLQYLIEDDPQNELGPIEEPPTVQPNGPFPGDGFNSSSNVEYAYRENITSNGTEASDNQPTGNTLSEWSSSADSYKSDNRKIVTDKDQQRRSFKDRKALENKRRTLRENNAYAELNNHLDKIEGYRARTKIQTLRTASKFFTETEE